MLANSVTYVLQGVRLPGGGCQFSGQMTLGPEQNSVTELELAFDPDTCRSLIERGILVTSGDMTNLEETATSNGSTSVATSGPSASSTLGTWRATFHSWFEDPPGIHVNDVINIVEWSPDGVCALPPGTTANVSFDLRWLTTTGWSLASHTWDRGGDCLRVWSGSTAQFTNGVFCLGFDTHTWYEPNYVEGRADSSAGTVWSVRKEGFCAFLLSANRTLDRQQIG